MSTFELYTKKTDLSTHAEWGGAIRGCGARIFITTVSKSFSVHILVR